MKLPKAKPGGNAHAKPNLRLQKLHIAGKSAFPTTPAAFGPGPMSGPGPQAAFSGGGDSTMGAAPGDAGE